MRRVRDKLRGTGYVPPAHRRSYAMASAVAPLAFVTPTEPATTIVVPAYGEPLATFSCLRSVHATVRHGEVEVIVVGDEHGRRRQGSGRRQRFIIPEGEPAELSAVRGANGDPVWINDRAASKGDAA